MFEVAELGLVGLRIDVDLPAVGADANTIIDTLLLVGERVPVIVTGGTGNIDTRSTFVVEGPNGRVFSTGSPDLNGAATDEFLGGAAGPLPPALGGAGVVSGTVLVLHTRGDLVDGVAVRVRVAP